MTARSTIIDGTGSKQESRVNQDHALLTTSYEQDGFDTPISVLIRNKLYRSFLKNSSGSKDMNINGSVTPVEFYISAQEDKVFFITNVRLLLNGAKLNLGQAGDFRRFGPIATNLTNGITLVATQGGENTSIFETPIKNTGDWFDYSDAYLNFVSAISVGVDFLSVDLRFEKPIVLTEGSRDRLVLTIQDDLSTFALFQVSVRGYQQTRYNK